jgi:hypothetical protein
MSELDIDDIHAVVGKVNDIVAAEIIGTGITRAQLEEAVAWVKSDVPGAANRRELPASNLGQVIAILERVRANPADTSLFGEGGSTLS